MDHPKLNYQGKISQILYCLDFIFSIPNICDFPGWGSCSSGVHLEPQLCTPVLVYLSQFKHVGSSATGACLLWYFPSALELLFPVSHFSQAQWLLCSCDSFALNHACLRRKGQGNVSGTSCWVGAPAHSTMPWTGVVTKRKTTLASVFAGHFPALQWIVTTQFWL